MKMNFIGRLSLILLPLSVVFNLVEAWATIKPSPSSYELRNDNILVKFNGEGLQYIYDSTLHKRFGFVNDGFMICIDGKQITNDALNKAQIIQYVNKIIYNYETSEFQIKEVFKIKNGWHFVSKQLFIIPKKAKDFHVDQIRVIKEQIDKSIFEKYTIKSLYKKNGTKGYGVFLRFKDHIGMFALVQNPFLSCLVDENKFSITYSPDMEWKSSYGIFSSDIACIGTYELQGPKIPTDMTAEWKQVNEKDINMKRYEYQSEVEAFTNCVSHFVIDQTPRPLKLHIGWTENDYQIDVSTASGREVYKRIINRAAGLGLNYIVFQPTNSLLGNYLQTSDTWHAEDRLWLGLGIEIRKNKWDPLADSMPLSIQSLLSYAKGKNIKLLAYVYPDLPFEIDTSWIVSIKKEGRYFKYANLGSYALQNWLIKELSEFKRRTGIGGYSFDYTYLNLPGKSVYAQWWGWRRVMDSLRRRFPDIIMDGRQTYQEYGPWSWLAGSYPHPTSEDEQPQSFVPFPDLHFDRVSADRERYTAYRYRIREYCPQILMPGFIGHQTNRFNIKHQHIREPYLLRDWDQLGWKYSLISSIGYAGLNNVVNMIPARDPEEYRQFSKQDISFFKNWMNWVSTNKKFLEQTKPILGQPALGKVDGTSAILNNKGFIFLFNPNGRSLPAIFPLNNSIGLKKQGRYLIKEIYPQKGKMIGNPELGFWNYGDSVNIPLDGASAKVFKIIPVTEGGSKSVLFNVTGRIKTVGNHLILSNVRGEVGTSKKIIIFLKNEKKIKDLNVNGEYVSFYQRGNLIYTRLKFEGIPFHHMQEIGHYDSLFAGGIYNTSFKIPEWVFSQLRERKKDYSIPWSQANYNTPWLVPERLPLFIQIAEPSDTMKVVLKINGKIVGLTKAYSSVVPYSKDFVGFYIDCSKLRPGKEYSIELELPELNPGQFQGLFFDNIVTKYTSKIDLKE